MMTDKFQIQHKKSTPYQPQENGAVEEFNKVLEHALTKVWNENHDNWDMKIPTILWAYKKTCKILMGQTPSKLFYGQ